MRTSDPHLIQIFRIYVVTVSFKIKFTVMLSCTFDIFRLLFLIIKFHFHQQEGMKQQLDQIKLKMSWIERLDLSNDLAPMTPEMKAQLGDNDKPSDPDDTLHNDFKCEMNL